MRPRLHFDGDSTFAQMADVCNAKLPNHPEQTPRVVYAKPVASKFVLWRDASGRSLVKRMFQQLRRAS